MNVLIQVYRFLEAECQYFPGMQTQQPSAIQLHSLSVNIVLQ